MIRKENNLLLGIIAKPHGTKGSVLIRLRNIKPEEIKKRDWVFVEIDGLLVPFFIEEFRPNADDSLVLKFEHINSESDARSLSGCEAYIASDHIKHKRNKITNISVSGYKVIDKSLGFIGIAHELTGMPSNPLLRIRQAEKEWLIPVHEDIILEINDADREIVIDAPEGLFAL
ncbi:MAG TPA: ribosome maturation factor RimM [Bacteroidales bacterium]|jgi:16S rRNA processing protein RimM|nr:ribosome maturation factor RimM [Bacteroidales bacterium]